MEIKKQEIKEVWVFRREFNSYYNPFFGYKTKDDFAAHCLSAESVYYGTDSVILGFSRQVEPLRIEIWEINTPYAGNYPQILGKQKLRGTDIYMGKQNYQDYIRQDGVYVIKEERTYALDLQTLAFYKNVDKFKFGAKEIRF